MNEALMHEVLTRGMWIATICTAPLLAVGGGVGLLISIVQAATQLNEPAIAFVPKLMALGVALVFLGPWITDQLSGYTTSLYTLVAEIGAMPE
jgi:flagellar biosynthetic protein FliQ